MDMAVLCGSRAASLIFSCLSSSSICSLVGTKVPGADFIAGGWMQRVNAHARFVHCGLEAARTAWDIISRLRAGLALPLHHTPALAVFLITGPYSKGLLTVNHKL
jgi:hypothetical protein